MRASVIVLAMLAMTRPAAAETVHLYAAGNVAKAYQAMTGNKIDAKYGPSGILKNEICAGATANVFASANMEHPQALHDEKKSGPVFRFARNQLCALVKPGRHVAEGRADIFVTYCTNAVAAQKEDSSQQMVALPETLTVGANYGLTVINGGPPAAQRFADFILSSEGQKLLASHGFIK
jgi:ABC-type molybdate transport system substrate-binding protein